MNVKMLNYCPRCEQNNVTVQREPGCAFVVFLFVSMGLGLVMYPFLPLVATCNKCGARWRP